MAALPYELVEEILLRVSPDDPTLLVRAAVACKGWCRLVSCSGFLRRFRERHRTPPMLGVIRNVTGEDYASIARFVATGSSLWALGGAERRGWRAVGTRHGRVLLQKLPTSASVVGAFAVWYPLKDELRELPPLPQRVGWPWASFNMTVTVTCATEQCDHLDCSRTPFLVVVLGSECGKRNMCACAYSSKDDAWSQPTYAPYYYHGRLVKKTHIAHAGNTINFLALSPTRILQYQLVTHDLTVIDPPATSQSVLTLALAEGGGLGCITVKGFGLYLWSRESGPNGEMGWTQARAIDIKNLAPVGETLVFVHADDSGVVYVASASSFLAIDIKSGQARLVDGVHGPDNIFPYISFYTPALRMPSTGVDTNMLVQVHETSASY